MNVKSRQKEPTALVDATFTALSAQTVTVAGSAAAELVACQQAAIIKALEVQRGTIVGQVEEILDGFLLAEV